jgi:hypothetical protein
MSDARKLEPPSGSMSTAYLDQVLAEMGPVLGKLVATKLTEIEAAVRAQVAGLERRLADLEGKAVVATVTDAEGVLSLVHADGTRTAVADLRREVMQ